jgi:hypothetical protein
VTPPLPHASSKSSTTTSEIASAAKIAATHALTMRSSRWCSRSEVTTGARKLRTPRSLVSFQSARDV